eukprot:UN03112
MSVSDIVFHYSFLYDGRDFILSKYFSVCGPKESFEFPILIHIAIRARKLVATTSANVYTSPTIYFYFQSTFQITPTALDIVSRIFPVFRIQRVQSTNLFLLY